MKRQYTSADRVPISEAAEIVGVCARTLRNWEKEPGKAIPCTRTAGGKRRYLVADLDAHNDKYRQGAATS